MKPHEVVKNSLEKLAKDRCTSLCSCKGGVFYNLLVDSQLSLILSVKEMVDKEVPEIIKAINDDGHLIIREPAGEIITKYLSSLLTEEIDKIKK